MIAAWIIGYLVVGLLVAWIVTRFVALPEHNRGELMFGMIFIWPAMIVLFGIAGLMDLCGWVGNRMK